MRAGVDVTAVLGAMWLGLINHEIGKCLDVELARAVDFGFEAVIAAIRA